jgi:predicted acylesterase/phospholipase RssA
MVEPIEWFFDTLVLSGGGVRGISLVGALHVLDEHKCLDKVTTYIGSSIGALICSLLAIGYTTEELHQKMIEFDVASLHDMDVLHILSTFGLDSGRKVVHWIEELFAFKQMSKAMTFRQLYEARNVKLILTGTCVNTHSTLEFSNKATPNLEIIKAIRMSISIPIVYNPVLHKNRIVVDGGLLNNFPLSFIDLEHLDQEHRTIALKLKRSHNPNNKTERIDKFEDYCRHLFYSLMDELSALKMKPFENNDTIDIIEIDTGDHTSLPSVELSMKDRENLFEIGRHYAAAWLEERIDSYRESLIETQAGNLSVDNKNS